MWFQITDLGSTYPILQEIEGVFLEQGNFFETTKYFVSLSRLLSIKDRVRIADWQC